MSNISYNDKSQTAPYDASKWNAQDANEVKSAVNTHIADNANPHGVTKGQVGLGSVDNTSDASKPVSTAQAAAIAAKVDKTTTINGKALDTDITINKTDVGLSNVDNTSDVNKPLSTAAQSALNNKKDIDKYTSTAHGFAVGEAVYRDNTGWHRSSNADNTITSKVDGVVIIVPNADSFVLGRRGDKFLFSGVSGTNHFLGSGSPNYTTSETTTVGKMWQHLFTCDSSTEATVVLSDQYEVTDPATSSISDGSITNAKLSADVKIGSLASLTTTVKTDVVSAINEVKSSVGSAGADKDYISLPPLSNPGSFTAAPDGVSGSSVINLTWTDVTNETNYMIQRSTSPSSGYVTINSPAAGATSYSDTGRTGSTTYYYRMKAVGNGGTNRDSEWVFANATTDVGTSIPVFWKLNLSDQFQDPSATPAGWDTLNNTGGTAVTTVGGINATSLKDADGNVTAVGFTNVTALNGTRSVSIGSGNGVFPDFIETQGWEFPNAGQVKFTGLDNAKQYTVYVHGNAQTWEAGTISFTVGATTSSQINTSANVGNATTYPDWETDVALISINNITPVSGEIVITLNVVSGLGMVDAIVLKQQ